MKGKKKKAMEEFYEYSLEQIGGMVNLV